MNQETILRLSHHFRFRGKDRLLSLVGAGQLQSKSMFDRYRQVRCLGGITLRAINSRDIMFRELCHEGYYQDDVLVALLHLLSRGGVFWDVGANCGYMSIFAEKFSRGPVEIHAFEPNPVVAENLDVNIALNDCSRIRVQRTCLSDRVGSVDLFVSKTNSWNTTIIPEFGKLSSDDINAPVTVECTTIEEAARVLTPPDVIKIDVEGAEHLVLAGGWNLLSSRRPSLIVEFNRRALAAADQSPREYLEKLLRLDYVVRYIRRPWFGFHKWKHAVPVRSEEALPGLCNLVCTTRERLAELEERAGEVPELASVLTGSVSWE